MQVIRCFINLFLGVLALAACISASRNEVMSYTDFP